MFLKSFLKNFIIKFLALVAAYAVDLTHFSQKFLELIVDVLAWLVANRIAVNFACVHVNDVQQPNYSIIKSVNLIQEHYIHLVSIARRRYRDVVKLFFVHFTELLNHIDILQDVLDLLVRRNFTSLVNFGVQILSVGQT